MTKDPIRHLMDDLADRGQRHHERNTPSGFDIAIADRISMLNADHWDFVTNDASLFLERGYLHMLERTGPDDIGHRYALVFAGQEPVAAVAAQVTELAGDQLIARDDSKRKKLAGSLLSGLKERLLVCGNLLSSGRHGVAFATGHDPSTVWPGVAEALYRIRRADKLRGQLDFLIIKDIPQDKLSECGALARFSYRSIDTGPDMVLAVRDDWDDFEDYLASLSSKYRRAIRKIEKQTTKAGLVVERCGDVAGCADRLHDLYMNVVARAGVRTATLTPAYLAGLAECLGDRFVCIVVRREGVDEPDGIVGFVTILLDEIDGHKRGIGYYLGRDYEVEGGGPLYFRLLHAVLQTCIEARCDSISLGRTALEPKARLGCEPESMHIWMRHRVSALNVVLRETFKLVPAEEAPDRNPFKD